MDVKLVSITPDAEKLMAYCARVSSEHQASEEYEKLLKYCIKHGHWSVFELADATVEITTSRAIAAQILRHRSFTFQEFSQRYAEVSNEGIEIYDARSQDTKNRQNSIDNLPAHIKVWWLAAQKDVWDLASQLYKEALDAGIAKECARMILPLNTQTKLYMKGSIRSWIHYINLRTGNGTQLEHKEIAEKIKAILTKELPVIAKAAWSENV